MRVKGISVTDELDIIVVLTLAKLRELLIRAAKGEDPEEVYLQELAAALAVKAEQPTI